MEQHEPIIVSLEDGPLTPTSTTGFSGASVTFVGRTRGETHPELGTLTSLYYTAQEAIALSTMHAICKELVVAFDLKSIALRHALSHVATGEASVEVVVQARHRAEAFSACAQCMNELKERVPIWKQEHFDGGTKWSNNNTSLQNGSRFS